MDFKKNKQFIALISGGVLGVLVSGVLLSNVFQGAQLKLGDFFQAQREVRKDIVIVGVDETTISPDALGPMENWSRSIWAQAINNLSKYNPKVVGLDFFFKSAKDKDGDNLLAAAFAAAPEKVIFYKMNPGEKLHQGYFTQGVKQALNPLPLELFRSISNVTVSTAKAFKDEDEVVRRMMPFIFNEDDNTYFENFPFAIARIALGALEKPSSPDLGHDSYSIALPDKRILTIPLENGQMVINYASVPGTKSYQYISFLDLYNDNYSDYNDSPEKLFENKIVLIGPKAFSFNDVALTGATPNNPMYGVEIHANALQTILDQAFLRNMTQAEKIFLIFALSLLSAFVFLFTKIRWSIVYLLGVGLLYTLAAPFAFSKGLILDLIHPYLVLVMTFISIYIYRYLTEFKEKIALRGAFAKYVNPTLAQQIAEHPEQLKLGGEKRSVTVLFTDIAHFTTISEGLTPESLVSLLNEYFDAMSEVVLAQGGTLDKFEGDAIMAFFGAPIAYPDHALRAVNAAVGMRFKLNELLQKWKNDPPLPGGEKKPVIDFRCGISSGEVIVGNIGSKERFEYTVMGDIVNLGSRLEGANKKYSTNIMLSEATYEQVKDYFECRELDIIRVVGKTKPIRVYEVLSTKGQLPEEAMNLLQSYNEGISLYHGRKYADGLEKFKQILQKFPQDGPSKMYLQRCEVLRDFPKPEDWDEVFEMGSK